MASDRYFHHSCGEYVIDISCEDLRVGDKLVGECGGLSEVLSISDSKTVLKTPHGDVNGMLELNTEHGVLFVDPGHDIIIRDRAYEES